MKNLEILQIGESWITDRAGGMNRYYTDLISNLSKSGIKVQGLVLGSKNVEEITKGTIKTLGPLSGNLIPKFIRAYQYFKKNVNINDFDVIVSHFSLYTFPLLPLIQNKPLIIQFHGPFAFESGVENKKFISNKIKYFIEKTVYSKSKKFIVLSKAFKNVLIEKYNIPKEYIEIIPGGVDTNKFHTGLSKQEARDKFNIDNNRPVIVCVRRLVKRMGLENLIESIAEVKKKHPDVLLLIAGKGVLLDSLREKVNELGLQDNIKLLGFIPDEDLPILYNAADFSIVPTTALEGFGLIVLESLASGTPVMVTPVGGLPEVIQDFSPELILPSSEKADLLKGILSVLNGDVKLPKTEQCLNFVRTTYDWSIITKKIYNSYNEFLDNYK